MGERRRSIMACTLLAVCAVTGCTATEAGDAVSASATAAGSPGAGTNGASAITLGSRPAELSVRDVDPCALITAPQQAQLGLHPGHRIADDPKYHGPSCDFQLAGGATVSYFDVTTVPTAGITTWLDPSVYDDVAPVTVGGFPAVRVSSKQPDVLDCTNAVSVAEGQMLMVTFAFVPEQMTRDQACARTSQVATAALATLRAMG